MSKQAHVRDSRQPGHFWADNEIVDDYLPQIGVYGFAIYMLLCKYADAKTGQCDPSVGGMAKKLQISSPTVKKALTALEECGLIKVEYRPRAARDRKVNDTNIYTLLAVEKKAAKGTQGDWVPKEIGYGVPNHVGEGTQGDWVGVPNHVGTNNTQLNNTQLTTPTPTPPTEKNEPKTDGAGGGDEIAALLDEYNIGAADDIAALYRRKYPDLDIETVRQSIENLLADNVPKGAIVNRLRNRPPALGKPYQRSRAARSPPNGTTRKGDLPLVTAQPKRGLSLEERRKVLEAQRNDTS